MPGCHDCPAESTSRQQANDPVYRRVLWFALVANLAMFFVEILASLKADSMALQADALDFFGDAVNYGITLFVLGMAMRFHSYAALFKGFSMGLFGAWVIYNAIMRAISGSVPEPMTMGGIALLALFVNVGVALMLYAYRNGDSNMRSIWLCSRNDAIGNLAVLAAAGGVFALGSRWPDLLVAVLIASLSLTAAVQVIRQAMSELSTNEAQQTHA